MFVRIAKAAGLNFSVSRLYAHHGDRGRAAKYCRSYRQVDPASRPHRCVVLAENDLSSGKVLARRFSILHVQHLRMNYAALAAVSARDRNKRAMSSARFGRLNR
jgi:hypothetical protein